MKVHVQNKKTEQQMYIDAVDAREFVASGGWELIDAPKTPKPPEKSEALGVLGGNPDAPEFDASIEAPEPELEPEPAPARTTKTSKAEK